MKTLKIFLVDDNRFSRYLYEAYLKALGYEHVTLFEDGIACLDQLHDKPDVIFLDHGLPYLTGLEVLQKIKRINPDIHIVIISGQDDMSMAIESLNLGAFDYIIKNNEELCKVKNTLDRISHYKQIMVSKKPLLQKIQCR